MLSPCQNSYIISVSSEVIGLSSAKGSMNQTKHMRTGRVIMSASCHVKDIQVTVTPYHTLAIINNNDVDDKEE